MQFLQEKLQSLAEIYGATRLLAYGTAIMITIVTVVVVVLLYFTRNEEQ